MQNLEKLISMFNFFLKIMKNNSADLCPACNPTKINVSEEVCATCKIRIKEVQKTIERDGYTTWPIQRIGLKIGYAGVIRTLDYMVKNKILLPPDENGKYYLVSGKSDKNL